MSDKKQTAVQWLLEQWPILESQLPSSIIDEAKAMEKEQIEDAVSHGWDNNENGKVRWLGEQYYKEKFGGQDEK
jgi:hypothetical protein